MTLPSATILDYFGRSLSIECVRVRSMTKARPGIKAIIDAAHLVPFSEGHNDHPTNGLALCKNQHWAMDRHLIAPGPDMVWHFPPILQAHRSSGKKELPALAKRAVLPPREAAFRSDQGGLEWRLQRLIA